MLLRLLAMLTALLVMMSYAEAREQIRIAGSSTVFPFVATAAEQFGDKTPFKTPIVEATGTGGGIQLFCSANDPGQSTDMANASRPMKDAEKELCHKNGVNDIIEIPIGYDGIVIANAYGEKPFHVTLKDLFLALALEVPREGKLVQNPYTFWNEVNPALPNARIEVYGPPPTSGTRDAFVEIVMEKICKTLPEYAAKYPDKDAFKKACAMLREDGGYIDAGENDNIIVQKLTANPSALGIFGFSFLEENASVVQGATVDARAPTFENITSGRYPISRTLFIYVKGEHMKTVPGIKEFLSELLSDDASSEDGYLALQGLIPLNKEERKKVQERVKKL